MYSAELAARFGRIARTSPEVHAAACGGISYMYRPNDRAGQAFPARRLELDRFSLATLRPQYRYYRDGGVRSSLLTVHRFRFDRDLARVTTGPEDSPAAWDVAVPSSCRRRARYILQPRRNRSGAQAAVLLHRALLAAVRGWTVPATAPEFPIFLLRFRRDRPPVPERTASMLAAVRLARPEFQQVPDAGIDDLVVREVFESLHDRAGREVLVPQWLLAREPGATYPTHPVTGRPRPAADAAEGARAGDWVMVGGNWVPLAQPALGVVADLSPLLDRPCYAAWEILAEDGIVPGGPCEQSVNSLTDAQWAEIRAAAAPAVGEEYLKEWLARASLTDVVDLAAARAAFEDVRVPHVFADESRIGVVQLQGYASPETLTFRQYGGEFNLFDVNPAYGGVLDPVRADHAAQLQRGLPVAAPAAAPPTEAEPAAGERAWL